MAQPIRLIRQGGRNMRVGGSSGNSWLWSLYVKVCQVGCQHPCCCPRSHCYSSLLGRTSLPGGWTTCCTRSRSRSGSSGSTRTPGHPRMSSILRLELAVPQPARCSHPACSAGWPAASAAASVREGHLWVLQCRVQPTHQTAD